MPLERGRVTPRPAGEEASGGRHWVWAQRDKSDRPKSRRGRGGPGAGTSTCPVVRSGHGEVGASDPPSDGAPFPESEDLKRHAKGGGTASLPDWDSPSDQACRTARRPPPPGRPVSPLPDPPRARTCLPLRRGPYLKGRQAHQGRTPASGLASPPRLALSPPAPRTGRRPGPRHPPAAALPSHPQSQGKCPASHRPAGPAPRPPAGGRLPGLLHTPGQVPSLTLPHRPLPAFCPPPGRGMACTPRSALLPVRSQPMGTPSGLGAGREPSNLLTPGASPGRHRSPFILLAFHMKQACPASGSHHPAERGPRTLGALGIPQPTPEPRHRSAPPRTPLPPAPPQRPPQPS